MIEAARHPTGGELLWTWRRRCGLSTVAAAKLLDVAHVTYLEAEYDCEESLPRVRVPLQESHLSADELVKISRRRKRMTEAYKARRLGINPRLAELVVPTPGEQLWTWRKRHRFSVTLAAKRLSMLRLEFIEAEHDRLPDPTRCPCPLSNGSEHPLTAAELLRIRRKRSRLARDDVAISLGISHVTYLKLERWADQRIIDLWFGDKITPISDI